MFLVTGRTKQDGVSILAGVASASQHGRDAERKLAASRRGMLHSRKLERSMGDARIIYNTPFLWDFLLESINPS
jgi:hypothetical protein